MAEFDHAVAKQQIRLLTLPRSQHPYGAIPAFEWDFNAVNPPLVAWAVWQIYQIERSKSGTGDLAFLKAMFEPLVMMMGWWLNRKDSEGKGIFSGGFLGLDTSVPSIAIGRCRRAAHSNRGTPRDGWRCSS
jgi:hypothetical protein